ncbi:hypothetical protein [Brevibacillus laterosporus]|uniref:Uncharacterized protein n=1 Tax=Brevibacillus laterosporus TaxID=1465 RepID=A0AAP3DCH1_BRELA|nr:hypothetical protein [Brevibacillus laterosporus]AYB41043.1 hypothetical protein D5F52_23920 [Brevibacillus laterosporus]MBM7106959.1 hypothetical protein [Brevibacillus laterosporus]MCR8978693.1 hypothetical protein [Brevibacillus laterosporus]MCZ0805849.1 hypothetical protein [Brevibacillus laterosporus]MCZ0824385.1 hypothetical protein [Brevibacillus laterosporus]
MGFLSKILEKRPKITVENVREACLLVGFFSFGYGLWQVYPPSMWIICGLMVLFVGLPARKEGR